MQVNRAVYSIFLCSILLTVMLTACQKSKGTQPAQADIAQAHQNVANYIYNEMQSDSYKTGKMSYHPFGTPQEIPALLQHLTLAEPAYETLYPSIVEDLNKTRREYGDEPVRLVCLIGFIYKTEESDESVLFIQAKTDTGRWYMHQILKPRVLQFRTIEEFNDDMKRALISIALQNRSSEESQKAIEALLLPEILHRK